MDVRLNMTHVCSLWLSYQNTMLRFGPEPFSVPRQPITLRVFKAAECVDQWERSSTRKNLQFGLFSVCQTSQATIVQWGYCTLPQLLVRKYGFLFSDRRVCLRFQSFQWREDAQVCHCGEYNVFVQITASNVNVGCSWFDKTVRLKNNVHKTTHKFLFLCFIFLCIANMCLGCECETSLSFFLFIFLHCFYCKLVDTGPFCCYQSSLILYPETTTDMPVALSADMSNHCLLQNFKL